MSKMIKIDDKEYELESLGAETKAHLASVQAVDRQLKDLQEQIAIFQTARLGYVNALKALLMKDFPEELQ